MDDVKNSVRFQILRFLLAGENYAFDVLKTREVISVVKVTPLPNSIDSLSGVVNLRGSIIPVVDLRRKLKLEEATNTVDTSIIIVELQNEGELVVIGVIVDAVKGVVSCESSEIEEPPRFGMKLKATVVQSIVKKDNDFVVILDVDKLLQEDELHQILDPQVSES